MKKVFVLVGAVALVVIAAGVFGELRDGSARAAASWSSGDVGVRVRAGGRPDRLPVGTVLHMSVPRGAKAPVHFQWERCRGFCVPISGATHRAYRVRRADRGYRLRARITWRGNGVALSALTPEVGRPLPQNTSLPTVADGGQGGGTLAGPMVGDVLTGSNGSWTGAVRFTYRWLGCALDTTTNQYDLCSPIAGATSQTYALASSDVGTELEFEVTAWNF